MCLGAARFSMMQLGRVKRKGKKRRARLRRWIEGREDVRGRLRKERERGIILIVFLLVTKVQLLWITGIQII